LLGLSICAPTPPHLVPGTKDRHSSPDKDRARTLNLTRPARRDVSASLALRSTRPVAVGGGTPPTNQRRLDRSPDHRRGDAERPPRRWHPRSCPPRPWRCLGFAGAPLDTTKGRANEACPYEVTSSRPETRPPSGRRGETPTEVAFPVESARFVEMSRLRCRSARHDL
jgi:hypothetical protein